MMTNKTDKIRAALEDAYHISVIAADRRKFTEALSELDGCVIVNAGKLAKVSEMLYEILADDDGQRHRAKEALAILEKYRKKAPLQHPIE